MNDLPATRQFARPTALRRAGRRSLYYRFNRNSTSFAETWPDGPTGGSVTKGNIRGPHTLCRRAPFQEAGDPVVNRSSESVRRLPRLKDGVKKAARGIGWQFRLLVASALVVSVIGISTVSAGASQASGVAPANESAAAKGIRPGATPLRAAGGSMASNAAPIAASGRTSNALTPAVSAGGGLPISYSGQLQIDNADPLIFQGVACPSASLCVAVDSDGNVVTSTSPTGGPSAWKVTTIDSSWDSGLTGVSCPSTSLCVAVDDFGDIFTSSNPGASPPTWTPLLQADPGHAFFSVSCPSTSLCVAVDNVGNVVTSSSPTVAASWSSPADIDETRVINDIACPGTTLCLAVDNAGNVITSNTPTVSTSWSTTPSVSSNAMYGIWCAGITQCIASDAEGNVFTYTSGVWSVATDIAGSDVLGAVSCPSTALCVVADETAGSMLYSTNPFDASPVWTPVTGVDAAANGLFNVSCPSTTLCVAADANGNVFTSTSGGTTWRATATSDTSGNLTGASCTSTNLCVAVDASPFDNAGNVLTSTNPFAPSPTWAVTLIDSSYGLDAVTCPTTTLCVAVDQHGNVLTSTNPTGGASAWTAADVDGVTPIWSISCPSTTLCLAGDSNGNILESADPTGGTSAWQSGGITPGQGIEAISCPNAESCVLATDEGQVSSAGDASLGTYSGSWVAHGVASDPIYALTCPSTPLGTAPEAYLCVAGDADGNIYTGDVTNSSWSSFSAVIDAPVAGVSCSTVHPCMAVDGYGDVLPSVNPTGGPSAWGFDTINPDTSFTNDTFLTGVSCTTIGTCLLLDRHGHAVTATFAPAFGLLPGAANAIAIGGNTAWVLGTSAVSGGYGIYKWTGSAWAAVPGGAVKIAVGPDGNPWVVNSAHRIYRYTGSGWSWNQVPPQRSVSAAPAAPEHPGSSAPFQPPAATPYTAGTEATGSTCPAAPWASRPAR